MKEEIEKLMQIYAIGYLEALIMYCKEHDIEITVVKTQNLN